MIDLHLHLDGSLSIKDFRYLANKENIDLGRDFPHNVFVPENCSSLAEYLKRFDLPLKLLQSPENLEYLAHSLTERVAKLGLIYAEIRFAPCLHTQRGMSQLEAVNSVIRGIESSLINYPQFNANVILCCMRHATFEENMETVEVAYKLKGTRVVAVDLAGDEKLHPSSYYSEIFNKAKEYGLNITIHAGEATGSDEIMMAIDNGAMRIGHGVHLSLDEETVKRVKEKRICFEFCPTSNLQTKSLREIEDVPLMDFLKRGIAVTLNSDNMTVSNTDVIQETRKMIKTFNLTKGDIAHLIENSIIYSFTCEDEKNRLLDLLDDNLDDYWLMVSH